MPPSEDTTRAPGFSELPAFSELFSERCLQLGLLSAPEIAQRIARVQPAAARIDLARNVRNWLAGRNVPRPDFYRILLMALEVDKDRALCANWHRAYKYARAANSAKAKEEPETGRTEVCGQPDKPDVLPELEPDSKSALTGSGNRQSTFQKLVYWGGALMIAILSIFAATWHSGASPSGLQCDQDAGAGWDPFRNPQTQPRAFLDIRAAAIKSCQEALRDHPQQSRYWFQLGRAFDRDAKWHGSYQNASWAYRRALDLGHDAAALSLGILYEEGSIDSRPGRENRANLPMAAYFYERAAAAGLPMGLYCHAIATLFGWSGKAPDPARAMLSASAAVAAGSHRAIGLVADLKARAASTRHVECSRSPGSERRAQPIQWAVQGKN